MSTLDHLKWRTDERLVLLERLARRSGLARAADAGERLSELDLGHALGVDLHGVRTRYAPEALTEAVEHWRAVLGDLLVAGAGVPPTA